jgi:hypothetical protein
MVNARDRRTKVPNLNAALLFLTDEERQALALLRKRSRRRQFGLGNTGSIVWHSMSE